MEQELATPGFRTDPHRPGVFISYARADGAQAAYRLTRHLTEAGLSVWRDRDELVAGDAWWHEIREALAHVSSLVLVLSEGALRSSVVQGELRLARQQGIAVRPVVAGPISAQAPVPRWLKAIHWYELDRDADALVLDLGRAPRVRRVPFMAQMPPEDFVQRDEEFEQIVELLAGSSGQGTVAITAALRGAGGFGKTTLARAVCHDPRIQEEFHDGVLWVTLGENPTRAELIACVADLVESLDGQRPGFAGLDAAAARLQESLSDRCLLFVIDDVWNSEHLAPFLRGGTRCARLVTTRNSETLPLSARRVCVDQMRSDEASRLLGHGIDPAADAHVLRGLASRLGEWPLLLKLANGVLRRRIRDGGDTFRAAVQWMHEALDRKGVLAFDTRNAEERSRAVARTIRLSLDCLDGDEVERYFDLAVFAEDLDIPVSVLQKFWRRRGGLDAHDAENLCMQLHALSLLQQLDLTARTIRLHDAIRHFLCDACGSPGLAARHAALLDALCEGQAPQDAALDDPYLLRYLGHHLCGAGQPGRLADAVVCVRYAAAVIQRHKSWSFLEDLVLARQAQPDNAVLPVLARDIARCGHILDGIVEARELEQTLRCRMAPIVPDATSGAPAGPALLARQSLQALHPSFERSLRAESAIRCCTFGGEGTWLAAGSSSGTAWVFDATTGKPRSRIAGHHSHAINGMCALRHGGSFATVGDDGCPVLWDAASGDELAILERAGARLLCCCVDGSGTLLAAGSSDNRLRLWRLDDGRLVHVLGGHAASIAGCRFSADGRRIACASADGSLSLWDVDSGDPLWTLRAHALPLTCCEVLGEGDWIVTGGFDGVLSVWSGAGGDRRARLRGHAGPVRACVADGAGRWLLSAGDDGTIRLWDMPACTLHSTFHDGDAIRHLALDPSGTRFATVGRQGLVNMWQIGVDAAAQAAPAVEARHQMIAVDPTGRRILTRTATQSLCLWDAESMEQVPSTAPVPFLPSGREPRLSPGARYLAVESANRMLLLNDLEQGVVRELGPCGSTYEFTPDGRQLVWLDHDERPHLVDVAGPGPVRALPGTWYMNDDMVFDEALLWISFLCDSDRTLRWFDLGTGECRFSSTPAAGQTKKAQLTGHHGEITRCRFGRDGNTLLTAGDDGVAIGWDTSRGLRSWTLSAGSHWVADALESSADGVVFTASWDGEIAAHRMDDGARPIPLHGHLSAVVDLAVSADGRCLLSASWDGTLRVWDVPSGRCTRILQCGAPINGCVVDAHATRAAAAGLDGNITLWNLTAGRPMAALAGHTAQVNRCMMDGAAKILVSASDDGSVRVWDLDSRETVRILATDDSPVIDLGLAADGRLLLTAHWDDSLALWDLDTGACIRRLELQEWPDLVQACALSPDGTRAAVAKGRTVYIFDVNRGWEISKILPRQFEVDVTNWTESGVCLHVDGRPSWLRTFRGNAGFHWTRAISRDRRHSVAWKMSDDGRTVCIEHDGNVRLLPELPAGSESARLCLLAPDGIRAALLFNDGAVRVCHVTEGTWLAAVHTGDDLAGGAWLSEGRRLLVGGSRGLEWFDWGEAALTGPPPPPPS